MCVGTKPQIHMAVAALFVEVGNDLMPHPPKLNRKIYGDIFRQQSTLQPWGGGGGNELAAHSNQGDAHTMWREIKPAQGSTCYVVSFL